MKVKRTHYLSETTVAAVRDLVEREHIAPSQDALVEMALADFFMALRYREEARRFDEARDDPEIAAEVALLEQEFRGADHETWPE
jgi:hypothetical protein